MPAEVADAPSTHAKNLASRLSALESCLGPYDAAPNRTPRPSPYLPSTQSPMAHDSLAITTTNTGTKRSRSKKKSVEGAPRSTTGNAPPITREVWGLVTLVLTILLGLALVSFRPAVDGGVPGNWVGSAGGYVANAMYAFVGLGAFGLLALGIITSHALLYDRPLFERPARAIGYGALMVTATTWLHVVAPNGEIAGHAPGGWIGELIGVSAIVFLGRIGAFLLVTASAVIALMVATNTSIVGLIESVRRHAAAAMERRREWKDRHDGVASNLDGDGHDDGAWFHDDELGDPRETFAFDDALPDAPVAFGANEDLIDEVASDDDLRAHPERRGGIWTRVTSFWKSDSAPSRDRWEDAGDDDEPSWTDDPSFADDDFAHDRFAANASSTQSDDYTVGLDDDPEDDVSPTRSTAHAQTARFGAVSDLSPGDLSAEDEEYEISIEDSGSYLAIPTHGDYDSDDRAADVVLDDDDEDDDDADAWDSAAIKGRIRETRSRATTRQVVVSGPSEIRHQPEGMAPPRSDVRNAIGPVIVEPEAFRKRKSAAELDRAVAANVIRQGSWEFPPLRFLAFEDKERAPIDHDALRECAVQLESALNSFKIQGTVTGICPGPVVTRYEIELELGTKLSKITGLTNDLAMALRATSVRIIAPIPGRGCVGIEVPNDDRETVYLKEVIADEAFDKRRSSKLVVALGKDIEGNPVVADLAKMPHLLLAGTTGSGKSVAVNAMITSILYNASPDDVRMIMIDPKQLEFAVYRDIPHLLLPVVTDSSKAASALQWAVQEMERRYKLMAELKVRNISGYNAKLADLHHAYAAEPGEIDEETFQDNYEPITRMGPDGRPEHRHMFFIVVIVDEFADLMMVAGKEVEHAVARLAQKARAAGIHVILATQRPSVDVITGLIKANFPTRMSCRLISGTDSRTVLDSIGAETLLGQGDMLYRPPGKSDLSRVHGAYVDEAEIEKIVDFLKAQRAPDYDEAIIAAAEGVGDAGDADVEYDERYDEAVAAVVEAGFASISMVQRKLRIGYNKSARIVEQMERDGVIGPATGGSSRREVLAGGGMAEASL